MKPAIHAGMSLPSLLSCVGWEAPCWFTMRAIRGSSSLDDILNSYRVM